MAASCIVLEFVQGKHHNKLADQLLWPVAEAPWPSRVGSACFGPDSERGLFQNGVDGLAKREDPCMYGVLTINVIIRP